LKIKTFSWRKKRSVRGRTSCAGEGKKIKEEWYRRRFFHGPRRRCATKLCATIWRNPDVAELLRWCTNASMGEWCSHTPHKFFGAQCNLCGVIHTPSLTTTKCGHHWRIRCKKHANYCSHPNQCKPNGWRKCEHRLWALTHSPSTVGQFIGGAVQYYYEQGYNNQDYQNQPPAGD
jgi:hypothetical protein